MFSLFPKHFFITGTDTEVGKSIVSAILTLGLKAAYWKPIQSGLETETDTQLVQRLTKLPKHHFFPESYRLHSPLSPHAAAKIDNTSIMIDHLTLPNSHAFSHLIVEGCGGVMVPLNEKGEFIADLIARWKMPTLVVSRSTLGTINHTLLTLKQLREFNIPIIGVILNGPKNPLNRDAIEKFGNVRVVGEIDFQTKLCPKTLKNLFSQIITQEGSPL